MADIARRNPLNPILRPTDLVASLPGLRIECLLNPGVFRFQNKTWLLVRVAERPIPREEVISFPIIDTEGATQIVEIQSDEPGLDLSDPRIIRYNNEDYLTTLSHLRLLCSDDNVHFTESGPFSCLNGSGPYETYGIEDCRVALINHIYYLTYTAVSPNGVGVGMITTADWKNFDRKGLVLPPHNKDCALFEEKINGHYYMLHRPSSAFVGGNYIWLAESTDLLYWGNHTCIARTRRGKWDSERIGAGGSPILTEAGWLLIYHGADGQHRYCLGALLLDANNPSRVIARSEEPIMEPVAAYEQEGFFGNVVFTNGHILNGDELIIYYGAADEVICSAAFSVKEILQTLLRR